MIMNLIVEPTDAIKNEVDDMVCIRDYYLYKIYVGIRLLYSFFRVQGKAHIGLTTPNLVVTKCLDGVISFS